MEQLECLMQEGCSVVQGYLFSDPQPGADIARTLDEIGIRSQRRLTRKISIASRPRKTVTIAAAKAFRSPGAKCG